MWNPFSKSVELASDQKDGNAPPVTEEKAKSRSQDDLFAAYGIDFKSDDDLDIADFRELMDDAQVRAAVMFKILARISSGWTIKPASEDPAHKEHAEYLEDQLENMRGTTAGFLRRTMLAMAYGQTIHEIVLNPIEATGKWAGKYTLKSLKWKRPENFRCKTDDYGNLEALEQKVGDNWDDPIKHDPRYFVIWAWDHEGDYEGRSDLIPAYRWVKAKTLIDWNWNVFLEKHATPTPIGKHPPGASDAAKEEMLNALSTMHAKKCFVVPSTWEVELLESERVGGDYSEKVKYCDRMISRTFLLPSLMMDEGESGAYALGKQHGDNFTWVLDALGADVSEEIILEQITKFLIDINFPDVEQYPEFAWKSYDVIDLKVMSEAMTELKEANIVQPGEPWIREMLGLPPYVKEEGDNSALPEITPAPSELPEGEEEELLFKSVELRAKTSQKHKSKEIKARTDKMEAAAVSDITAAFEAMYAGLKMDIRKRKIVENGDAMAVRDLKLRGIGPVRAALEKAFGDSLHLGAKDAMEEVGRGLATTGKSLGKLPNSMGINLKARSEYIWENEPESVVLSSAEIISFWDGKVPTQKALMAEYSREAFTMAGTYNDDMLSGSQRIIGKGIRRGASYGQIEQELAEFWKPYLEIEGAVDPGVATAYRVENIVRTTMAEAYNTGRMNLYRHPDVADLIVAFEYSAVMDRRTTPFCAEWDGQVLASTDPRVDANNPPNHYMCRSTWIPITRGETYSLTDEPPASQPATGFKI